jgi:hypothetical protein
LVETLQRSAKLASIWRIQHAIDVLQDDAGLIVLAFVDIRTVIYIAGVKAIRLRLLTDHQ